MSTIGLDSWAVDLAEVGAVYPFQGSEGLMVIVAIALWILWHIVQFRQESNEIADENSKASKENIDRSVSRY